ncbi:MAG: hypothetical protein OT477_14215 [Chloroflexi bacterium]|nr:hypothetical protein [Chloroflexota bacterium]
MKPLKVLKEVSLGRKLGKPQTSLEIIDDLLIVSTEDGRGNDGRIHALDIETLEERWTYDVPNGRVVRFPLVIPNWGLVLAPFKMNNSKKENALIALDVQGKEKWTIAVNDWEDIYSPTYHPSGYLFCITNHHRVLCFDIKPTFPKKLWNSKIESVGPLHLLNSIHANKLFWVVTPYHIITYTARRKEPQKVYSAPPNKQFSPPLTINNGQAHVATMDGCALAYNLETGQLIFEQYLGNRVDTGPIIVNESVFYGGKKEQNERNYELWALDANKGVLRDTEMPFSGEYGQFFAPLWAHKDWVISQYAPDNGVGIVFDSRTGEHAGYYELPAPIHARPIGTTESLFAADCKGNIKKMAWPDFNPNPLSPKQVHEILIKYFSLSEIKILCLLYLDKPDDHFKGDTVPERALSIIDHAQRHGKWENLKKGILEQRPDLQEQLA